MTMTANRWCESENLQELIASQFHSDSDSVHGPFHWMRVHQNGLWLSRRTGADPFVVSLFAWFHDSKRVNDYTDPNHGLRGADFALGLRGKMFDLEDADFELLMYACIWHMDKDFTDDITIGTCWDADRLDLGRVGAIPSAEFMNTDFGREVARAGSFYSLLTEDEKPTEPNQALQRINMLVTDHAPSSMLRAKHVYR
jgi:uncharacterized protein